MVRSAAISWKIGLAVTASALLWQFPALAQDRPAEEVEARPQPLEPKAVPVTLLPPASDALLGSWRSRLSEGAPVIMVRPAENPAVAQPGAGREEGAPSVTAPPAGNAAIVEPRSEPVKSAPITAPPARNVTIVQPSPEAEEGMPSIMARPAGNVAIVQPSPEPVEAAPIVARPAANVTIVQPRPEPEKIQEDATFVETPSLPERRPRVAVLPPVTDEPIVTARAEPAKIQNDASVAIPSLPGRSPFRMSPFKSEIVESGPIAPAPPKGNAASRFFANLWPGNKGASEGNASSPGPSTASNAAQGPAEDGQAEKPPVKRFLEGIQFWKK